MPPVPKNCWFDELAAFLGKAYWAPDTSRIQAFTYGTEQEVAFLVDALGLREGNRVLDIGCGPGRHSLALARRGIEVVGIDHSDEFVALARAAAEKEQLNVEFNALDVRDLDEHEAFDAVICLCQGGFGLLGGNDDEALIAKFAAALTPQGSLALTAFHTAFAVRFLDEGDRFDPATGVHHERATLRDAEGKEKQFDLWTTCFTPRELRLLARAAGLTVESVSGVAPGRYRADPPEIEHPELLLLARKVGLSLPAQGNYPAQAAAP
jgi:SAM-dependent methyltransferase